MERRERVILYSDLNNFFASVEIALHPELAGKPLIVCGDPKERRGIVLAKSEQAKKYGIKTAETVYSALKKCPDLVLVESHYHEYAKYSRLVTEIYYRYTDCVEECSIDECALDVTESVQLFGSGEEIAEKIRADIKRELGLTVSIGVSYNKIYAKLASDLKKPDAITVISKANYREKVFSLPVSDLLFVGKATEETLRKLGIRTIGELAVADETLLYRALGKRGRQLQIYARGEDDEPVKPAKDKDDVKSIGNSTTLVKDVTDRAEVKRWLYVLSESVSARLRDANVGRANTIHLVVRDDLLQFYSWQTKVSPTTLCGDIAKCAFELFCLHYPPGKRVRLLGITVSGFDHDVRQLTLDGVLGVGKSADYEKKKRAEDAVARIRKKYGYTTVQRGIVMEDEKARGMDIRGQKEEKFSKEKHPKQDA
ncbi:MAG: DNA polymerase IV [Clostridia bacterium]|nr:DNA polymerase IV [Clostridia bacterium]